MGKSKKEIEEILSAKPSATIAPETFSLLAVIRPAKEKKMISLYLDNLDTWVEMPVADIVDVEELDAVKIDGELCKLVLLDIRNPAQNNHYQVMLIDAMMSVSNLVRKTGNGGCGCGCSGSDSHKQPGPKIYKRGGKPTKVTSGGGKDCTHCKFINGSWWCIDWCM